MTQRIPTFCRVCEPSCGLIAEVDDGRLVALKPDRDHPVSKGFACHKGIAYTDIHQDPDRLNHPLRRRNAKDAPGEFETVAWPEAIAQIAAQIRAVQQQYGHDAVAGYIGNPTAFNALGTQALTSFFLQMG